MLRLALFSLDDNRSSLLASALKPDYELRVGQDIEALAEIMEREQVDVLLLDFDSNEILPERQLALFESLQRPNVPAVVMADRPGRANASEFLRRGAHDCIRRPPSLIELKVILRRASEHAAMRRELDVMRQRMSAAQGCDQLIGISGRMQVVYDLIRRLANVNAFVLITGESGTGKELVARAIHNLANHGGRAPFVAVSCGAIPETLIESELFGHEKGAFTGSTGAREGFLEQAGEGTLFLDEIGELSLNTQVKLLRVLQQKEFSRLGSNKLIPLKARVLFATHRNLQTMVDEGTFRRDLYFRVNIMRIHVPSLAERSEDIPTLARHFLKQYSVEYQKPVHDILPSAMEALVEHDWPGNVRELENAIQGALILTDGDSITLADLPAAIRGTQSDDLEEESNVTNFENLLRLYKFNLANKTITECNGNKTRAAQKLQVSRSYLHRLIRMGEGAA